MEQTAWRFSDDRGQVSTAAAPPSRVVAYIQAGATLEELGVHPVAVFGSFHDGPRPDPAKRGALDPDEVGYLGAGGDLDVAALLAVAPDLVVAVSYGGGQVYGLDPETAKHLEERVAVVVIEVGQAHSLARIRGRFAELARTLGAADQDATALSAAEERLRGAAGRTPRPSVLALSPAGPDQVHLARPQAWPELRELTGHGVDMAEPGAGPGASWLTTGWATAAELRPDIVLVDIRCNAAPIETLRSDADWRALESRARIVAWNPEAPCGAAAHAAFFAQVAGAIEEHGTAARGA
ncbi:ABC transporter substrate-binding protein [Streptomyces sp. NBC_00083]|uniref:ABC transporter substrate-binding protein n=1 Tax=Streptomyces sp. NBC_00083 TaxID=2975647 RepID=UPI0022521BC3|nr:ABC transporter substrate-binding protein [Streptomyces sp. NBC_00083]MCX5386845.1 ABC transporter substrate-binding protein [Streptomyces sp. NBC_00083]